MNEYSLLEALGIFIIGVAMGNLLADVIMTGYVLLRSRKHIKRQRAVLERLAEMEEAVRPDAPQ